jgi:serine/threonine-protein kinase
VNIDGNAVGLTPLQVPLPPGQHTLVLALAGHVSQTTSVTVDAGERPSFSFALTPEAVAVVDPTPARDPDPRPRNPRDRNPPPRPTGTLTIATTPWSEVFLGSRRLGTTPLANVRLPAGTHTLTLRAPGRPPRRQNVTIEPGAESRVRVAL